MNISYLVGSHHEKQTEQGGLLGRREGNKIELVMLYK